jgi:hypothetical protein
MVEPFPSLLDENGSMATRHVPGSIRRSRINNNTLDFGQPLLKF